MNANFADVPLWAAILSAAFLLLGSSLAFIGTMGLARLGSFYDRVHAPTLGTSWGAGGMIVGSMIFFTAATSRPVIHEILIGLFISVTTPVTLMLLGRASVYRDRMEGHPDVPGINAHEPASGATDPEVRRT